MTPISLSLASGYLALVECHRGSPERAEGVARQAVEIVESRNVALSGTTAICYLGLAAALIARGHLAEADDRLNLATELYQAGEPSVWLAQALILVAACQRAEGKSAQAHDTLKSTQATLDRLPDAGISSYARRRGGTKARRVQPAPRRLRTEAERTRACRARAAGRRADAQ